MYNVTYSIYSIPYTMYHTKILMLIAYVVFWAPKLSMKGRSARRQARFPTHLPLRAFWKGPGNWGLAATKALWMETDTSVGGFLVPGLLFGMWLMLRFSKPQ